MNMSQPSYAHATLASSIKVKERSTKGDSNPLLRLTFAKRAVSKFKKTLLRKGSNERAVAETTTPILPAIQASIASENICALLIQVDPSCDRAPLGDRHLRKSNCRRATIYATFHGDESQEIPSPVPVPVPAAFPAGLATTSSLMSALDRDISSWSSPDAPTPLAEPSSLMALIDDILLGRDSEPVPPQLVTPPATPLLVARHAFDGKVATPAMRPLRIMKKMPATSSLRVAHQEHLLPTPPASPLPEPSSSLPVPTPGERVEAALASLSLFEEIERTEKVFEESKIQRRQQWAEWTSTSASVETVKPARAAAPTVDIEDDTDYYMCLCPLGRASTAEEQTARRTDHLARYLVHPPEDFFHDRAYHALLRRWGHLVPELPAGSPVPEEFFRSLLV